MKVAIVGADAQHWSRPQTFNAYSEITHILSSAKNKLFADDLFLVSGGCHLGGVDIWAENVADALGISKLIFKPMRYAWAYYKRRNIKIAEECDVLYDLEPGDTHTSGGTWTAKYAKQIGKEVHVISVRDHDILERSVVW